MADKAMTLEQLEKHVDKFNVKKFKGGGTAAALPDVCPPYKMIRPILQAVLVIPFLSKKIKDAIKAFMGFMDSICP